MTAIPIPTRAQSQLTNADEKAFKQKTFDINYDAEYKAYQDRKRLFEANLQKAYALIFDDYCSTTMQNRVKEDENYKNTILNNPIKLLKKVRELMHNPAHATYKYYSINTAMERIFGTKQQENEQLNDYVTRFKQARDILKSHAGD